MNVKSRHLIALLIAGMLMLTMISLTGCKEKTETAEPAVKTETEQVVAAVSEEIEQTTCPVMDGAINKNLFTEYKGKKVYFCCPGCKEKFEENPEQYIAKLPQFTE
jgi:YHS domain-containing protein